MAQGNLYQAMQLEQSLTEEWYYRYIAWNNENAKVAKKR